MIRNVSTNYKIVKNILNKGFYFETSFFAKPKDGSKGEDAFAYNKTMMCVADGVGGWNHQGVDPSKYSSALITNYQKLYNKTQLDKINDKVLFSKACSLSKSIIGSSTFCSCRLYDNTLHTLNLGDSGYALIQNGKLTYKSKEQQHSFNFPYQVGTHGDNPMKAEKEEHRNIKENDIVILGTDGLWDNLYEKTLLDMIISGKSAKFIGDLCYNLSKKKLYLSPFCVNSNMRYMGGKPDDITILIGKIKYGLI